MRATITAWLPLGACLSLVACGGGIASSANGSDGGAGSVADGSAPQPGADAGPLPGPGGQCHATLPAQGSPCTRPGLDREYGGTGSHLLCSTLAICGYDSGTGPARWYVDAPASDCTTSAAENPMGCPAAFTTLPEGAACPREAVSRCVYDRGVCGCANCVGDGGSVGTQWECIAWPEPTSCPAARPRIGSACTASDQYCYYGAECTPLGQPDLTCAGDRWSPALGGDSCAVLNCR